MHASKHISLSHAAFTLLEVLVALGIFSFAVLGLIFSLHTALEASRSVQMQKSIRSQLDNRLARLSIPPLREFKSEVEQDGVKYKEEVRREEIKSRDLPSSSGYWRIRVAAEWQENNVLQLWDASHLTWSP